MDAGEVFFGGGAIVLAIAGMAWDAWRSRRRPTRVVEALPSHTVTVVPKSCAESGAVVRPATVVPAGLRGSAHTSLAVEAWASIAGGSEWEAKLATARRRIAQSPLFGDNALRRRGRDPIIEQVADEYTHGADR